MGGGSHLALQLSAYAEAAKCAPSQSRGTNDVFPTPRRGAPYAYSVSDFRAPLGRPPRRREGRHRSGRPVGALQPTAAPRHSRRSARSVDLRPEARMRQATATGVEEICRKFGNDRRRMMDIVIAVQRRFGCVSHRGHGAIARAVDTQRVEVESVVTFYAFLSVKPQGRVVIRLCNDIVDWMKGYQQVADAMAKELGVTMGETTPDGAITLTHTAVHRDERPGARRAGQRHRSSRSLTPERGRQRDPGSAPPPGPAAAGARWSATATTRTRWCARWCGTTSAERGPVHFAAVRVGTRPAQGAGR